MKKFLLALVVLAIASAPALAGPNENGVLVAHNTGIAYSSDLPMPPASPLPAFGACPDLGTFVNEMPLSETKVIWKVYAAFPVANSPRLLGVAWGIGSAPVDSGGIVVSYNGSPRAGDFSIVTANWPGDQSFVGMSVDTTKTATITELWWFAGYGYADPHTGAPQMWCVIPHNNPLNQFFVDDSVPRVLDPIAGYGCLGFGQPGFTPCPDVAPVTGACCFIDGTCQMLTIELCVAAEGSFQGGGVNCATVTCEVPVYGACCVNNVCSIETPVACTTLGGVYHGDNSLCVPDPCEVIPTEAKSWGQIKNSYR